MRNTALTIFLFSLAVTVSGCKKGKSNTEDTVVTKPGTVTGVVKDWQGKPLAWAKVKMENSVSSGMDYEAITDAKGRYAIEVGVGSFIAYATYTATFLSKSYEYNLECDNNEPFNKTEVVTRNFTWRTQGVKMPPLTPGYFGGSVYIEKFPGDTTFSSHLISFTLTPLETIDGRNRLITRRLDQDPARLLDIPVGRYKITALHDDGRVLKLRNLNTENFSTELEILIEPSILGTGNLFCWHCAAVEYRE